MPIKVLAKPAPAGNKTPVGSRHQPERTRQAILDAAEREFAVEGIDGARTDAIARSAGVNKALLYYYFHDKEALYGAVLDRVFAGLKRAIDEAMAPPLPPREQVLAYAAAHFDYIARSSLYPRLVQRQLMRAFHSNEAQVKHVCDTYFVPMFHRVGQAIVAGIRSGEFREVDPMQFIPSMVAVIVFYFGAMPVLKQMTGVDPLSPESLAVRRAAVLDFISAALFRSRTAGSSPVRPKQPQLQQQDKSQNPQVSQPGSPAKAGVAFGGVEKRANPGHQSVVAFAGVKKQADARNRPQANGKPKGGRP